MRPLLPVLIAAALGAAAPAVRAAPASPPEGAVGEVTVTGERPGPELWRVERDGHTLWLLGLVEPLPARMTWRSATVESVLGQSAELIPASTSVSTSAGPFALIGLYFDWRRTQHLPDGVTLKDRLPAPLYARFAALRARYAPHDGALERLRPAFAASALYDHALKAIGLVADRGVEKAVIRLATQHHVAVHAIALRIEHPKDVLADVRSIPAAAELACVEATVARLEHDLPALAERARAWAVGDVEALRRLPDEAASAACWDLARLAPRLAELAAAARRERAAAIDTVLARQPTSFALVPMDQLLAADGLLARLRAAGADVSGP